MSVTGRRNIQNACSLSLFYFRLDVATNHLPNSPGPLVWPGPLSPAKVYSRCPLYSTWFPLAVVCALSLPGRVVALVGVLEPVASSGGQFCALLAQYGIVVTLTRFGGGSER